MNEHGKAVWRHRTKPALFAERTYRWCDRVVLIDESEGDRRQIVDDVTFSGFDFTDWIPMTVEEHRRAKQTYKQAYV